MPLPPALAARLKKRGIIQDKEEVIAENYDTGEKEKKDEEEEIGGAPGCPNKYNPYHVCSEYCYDHWQEGTPENRLSEQYTRRRERMLSKYPLPAGWVEVYDAGIARHYYWCPDTDEVSWLSPRHPHAVIGEAAPKVAKEMEKDRDRDRRRGSGVSERREERRDEGYGRDRKERGERGREEERRERGERGRDDRRRERRRDDEREGEEEEEGMEEDKEMNDRDRLRRARKRGIDPMDPSAYSDVAEGKWSSGLFEDDKSGADTTAGGPLFQMRPYPAPGAILRGREKKD